MNTKNFFFFLFIISLSLPACQSDKGKDIPDVSNIQAPVSIKRFEQELFALDTNETGPGLEKLEKEYGEFADIFFGKILGSKDPRIAPEGHLAYIRGFITHPGVRKLYDTTQVVFADLDWLKKDFEEPFKLYKYYFPEQPLSGEVVTFISEYTIGGFLYGNNSIGVGLDFYLGASYPCRQYNPANPNFSAYLTRSFNKDHIVMKSVKLLVEDLLGNPKGNKLIDYMIHNGKKLYLLDHLLPHAPDTVKLEFSQKQTQWVYDNEANIWAWFISENLLYSSDLHEFKKYIEYSPNSPGMPPEAPGRTANFLGWQIVKAYMKRHPNTSLQQLAGIRDAQKIMDGSGYRPPR